MSRATLEQRVSALEKKVDALLANQGTAPPDDLRSLRGAFTGDDVMKQIFEEGQKIRRAESNLARRRKTKKQKARR